MANQLSEIQQKYKNCNLLIPSATAVQMNPFYKCTVMEVAVNTNESGGEIFKVGTKKEGKNWISLYSLCKPVLMKMATAAGIQFHPTHTTVVRENANTYVGKAYGAVRLPDGSYKTQVDTKRISLDDEENKYRLEFMDKSIKGIRDPKAAKNAADMFKGKWIDDMDEEGRPTRIFVIADEDREKYIERSVLVNMTLLRKTASEKAQTGAILRVIRGLLGIKGTYTLEELKKPFAVASVTFSPDYSDPQVRTAMLQQGMNSMSNMFGNSSMPQAIAEQPHTDAFNPDEYLENPAFASDNAPTEDVPAEPVNEPAYEAPEPPTESYYPEDNSTEELICSECGATISQKVYDYSVEKYGRPLCYEHQRGARG